MTNAQARHEWGMTAKDRLAEGVQYAAGYAEPIFYTKWYHVDGLERAFYRQEAETGTLVLAGRMVRWGEGEEQRVAVEVSAHGGNEEVFRGKWAIDEAEAYVSRRLRRNEQEEEATA